MSKVVVHGFTHTCALLLLGGCSTTYDSRNELISALKQSDGHSDCANARLATLLDRYSVLEVTPGTRACRGGDVSLRVKAGDSDCAVPITKVRFQASAVRTSTIDQDGWAPSGTPVRIERSMDGMLAVYVPESSATAYLDPGECGVFERRVREGLSGHLNYLRAVRQHRTAKSSSDGAEAAL